MPLCAASFVKFSRVARTLNHGHCVPWLECCTQRIQRVERVGSGESGLGLST